MESENVNLLIPEMGDEVLKQRREHRRKIDWPSGGTISKFIKRSFNVGVIDGKDNLMVINYGWLVVLFLVINIVLILEPTLFLPFIVIYIILEGLYLAQINKRWDMLKKYLAIGWLKRYTYVFGFIHGMTFKRWFHD